MREFFRESLLLPILYIPLETCSEVLEVECVSLRLVRCINEEGSKQAIVGFGLADLLF